MSQNINRRELLKVLAAATGATILSSVPNNWKTPIVEVGALPVHAQGSQGPGAISGTVQLNFGTASPTKGGQPEVPSVKPLFTVSVLTTALSATPTFDHSTSSANFYNYTINSVPAGIYTVRCSFNPCSDTQDDTNVHVNGGATTTGVNFTFTACPI